MLTSLASSKWEDEEVWRQKEKKRTLKDISRISAGWENTPTSHLCHGSFTTTGKKSEQSFDALTVEEGGRVGNGNGKR